MALKISTRGRYALRLMVDLALEQSKESVSLGQVAERQEISRKYLEQIVPLLNNAGLLRTTRGYRGGYQLVKAPNEYTLEEILKVTEGSLAPVACLEFKEHNVCPRQDDCLTLPVWEGLYRVIHEYVSSVTLQDIVEGQTKIE